MAAIEETRTVVIAMDRSDYAQKAFDWYWWNIRHDSDQVILVHVPEFHTVIQSPMEIEDFTTLTNLYAEEEQMSKEFVDKLEALLRDKNADGKVKTLKGRPGEVVVGVADEEGADFIITGSRGMGTIRRTLLGSVSDYIIHHSAVPVIICRH